MAFGVAGDRGGLILDRRQIAQFGFLGHSDGRQDVAGQPSGEDLGAGDVLGGQEHGGQQDHRGGRGERIAGGVGWVVEFGVAEGVVDDKVAAHGVSEEGLGDAGETGQGVAAEGGDIGEEAVVGSGVTFTTGGIAVAAEVHGDDGMTGVRGGLGEGFEVAAVVAEAMNADVDDTVGGGGGGVGWDLVAGPDSAG